MNTCQHCRQLEIRIRNLEAYLTSLGIPLPTPRSAGKSKPRELVVESIEPPVTACPPTWKTDTLGHRAPGNLPQQKHYIATPDEKIAIVECLD